MDFRFDEYMKLVKLANPNYGRLLSSSLHGLTTYLKDHANRADPEKVISLIDGIRADRRRKYKDALTYVGMAALKQNLLASLDAQQLSRLYRRSSFTEKVMDDILIKFRSPANWKRCEPRLVVQLKLEHRTCQAVQLQVAKLHKDLGTGFGTYFDAYILEEKEFNAGGEKDPCTRAARWVCSASNTINENRVTQIKKFLENAVRDSLNVCTMDGVDKVHCQIVGDVGKRYRTATPGSFFPSDKGGRALFVQAVARIAKEKVNRDLGCYLFGAVIRCHPFVDGNGRVARTLFAICQLQDRMSFEPITVEGEDKLLGFKK